MILMSFERKICFFVLDWGNEINARALVRLPFWPDWMGTKLDCMLMCRITRDGIYAKRSHVTRKKVTGDLFIPLGRPFVPGVFVRVTVPSP